MLLKVLLSKYGTILTRIMDKLIFLEGRLEDETLCAAASLLLKYGHRDAINSTVD